MMNASIPTHKVSERFADPDRGDSQRRDAQPIEDPLLADAEEEELAELWMGDPGNQGA